MVIAYQGKCDKCGKFDPPELMEVKIEPRGGGSGRMSEFWCLDCIRK